MMDGSTPTQILPIRWTGLEWLPSLCNLDKPGTLDFFVFPEMPLTTILKRVTLASLWKNPPKFRKRQELCEPSGEIFRLLR